MVGMALVSHRWVEKPLRYAQWSPARVGVIACGFLATFSSAGLLSALDRPLQGWLYTGKRYPKAFESSFELTEHYQPCRDAAAVSDNFSECSYPQRDVSATSPQTSSASPKTIYFVGDSHNASLQPLASRLVEENEVPRVAMFVQEGCLFSSELLRVDGEGDQCLSSNRAFLSKVLDTGNPGDVVVVTNRHTLYFLPPNYQDDVLSLEKGRFAFSLDGVSLSQQQALQAYANDLQKMSLLLAQKDISLVVKAPLPDWKQLPSQCHPQWFRPDSNLPEDCVLNRDEEYQGRLPVLALLRQLEAELSNLYVYDPFADFCGTEECNAFSQEGVPLFRDADHLNNYGADHLYPNFVEYLRASSLIKKTANRSS